MSAAATATGVYVYGVVRAEELPAVSAEGIAGTSVELLEHDGLAALVSKLPPGDLRVKRRDLNRHLSVLEEAFAETTIVPCAFGTVVDSEADVETALLSGQRDELLAALRRLDGMVQLNVKAVYDEEELLRALVSGSPELARLRRAAGYHEQLRLGELVAALVSDRREADAARLIDELSRVAEDVVVEPAGEYIALKASFLVPRKRVDKFDARLDEIARREQPRMLFEVIGPLPPTAFADATRDEWAS
jgi:hypothetical protein